MGRNYYCEYCEKSFKDDLPSRRRHLSGSSHQAAKLKYDRQFLDPKEVLAKEENKKPCLRIQQGVVCKFGTDCRFSHYTPEELWQLRVEVQRMEAIKQKNVQIVDYRKIQKIINRAARRKKIVGEEIVRKVFDYPEAIEKKEKLPPSMRLIEPKKLNITFEEWG